MDDNIQYGEYKPISEEDVALGLPFKVLLFNDDWHTFEEVIMQIVKAVKCSFEKARSYAFEVHVKGKATVYNGRLEDCLKVSSVLEEINLNTQVTS